ncbi:hypothetical protein KI387_002386 [Taxus chinensis]|uniref:Uncharacterized protein n=1 Tax=Taxus chinensis TaxID=29808 RepID=A0AA38GW57_TAXCH|nr:hypothetical protein KI387_002386 [Taxus chinensis]
MKKQFTRQRGTSQQEKGWGTLSRLQTTGVRAASRWVNNNRAYDYHQGKEVIAMKKLEDITSLLRLPVERVCEVKYMVEKLSQGRWGAGRWFDILIGACIYVIVRQSHLPLTIIEIAVIINCDVSELGRMYNRVLKYLDIKLPDVDLFIFLERAITSFPLFSDIGLEKTNKMMKHGRFLLQCAFQWFLTTGRHPLPIVAAILAFIAEVDEVNVGLEDISKELNVPMHTCKLRYKELQESLVRVGQSLPWGKDITIKTVIRHGSFLLQYLEIKENSKSKGNKSVAKDKEIPKDRIGTDKAVLLPFEVGTSPTLPCKASMYSTIEENSRLAMEKDNSRMHVGITGELSNGCAAFTTILTYW